MLHVRSQSGGFSKALVHTFKTRRNISTSRAQLTSPKVIAASAVGNANMKLYSNSLAFNPGKVWLAIVEKGVKCEFENINLFTAQQVTPEFMRINPAGTVPVLIDGDTKITESREILDYLDSLGEPLGGAGADRQLVAEWLTKFDAWDGNFFVRAFASPKVVQLLGTVQELTLKTAEARKKQNPDLADVYAAKIEKIKAGGSVDVAVAKAANQAQLEGLLDAANEQLTKTKWLAGEEYSMADVVLTTMLNRINTAGQTSTFLKPRPKVSEYYNTVKARPSFNQVFSSSPTPLLVGLGKALFCKVTGWY